MKRRTTQTDHGQHTSIKRVDPTQLLIVLFLLCLGGAFLAGLMLNASPERRDLAIQEAQQVLPYRILAKATSYLLFGVVVKIGLVILVGFGLYYVIRVGVNWLDLRSRQVYAKDGLFPVIEVQKGVIYDPNRDNAGAHPLIAIEALSVQKQAATKAERLIIRQTQKPASLPHAEQMPALEGPSVNLPALVDFRDVFKGQASINSLVLGLTNDDGGHVLPVQESLSNLVHVAIAGSSGTGKSHFLQCLAYQLATSRERVGMVLCDAEEVTLLPFAESDRLLYPLVSSPEKIAWVLQQVSEVELNRRRDLFTQYKGVSSLAQYNARSAQHLDPIAVLIDEATALAEDASVALALQTLALRGRKYGLFVVAAAQDWKHSTFDTKTSNQFSSRFQFGARNKTQARILLGETGAEEFREPGRCMAQLKGRPTLTIQAPRMDEQWIISNLPTGKPAQVIDLEPLPMLPQEDDTIQRVLELKENGLSDTAIARQVFKYGNSHYIEKVREILQQQQHD